MVLFSDAKNRELPFLRAIGQEQILAAHRIVCWQF